MYVIFLNLNGRTLCLFLFWLNNFFSVINFLSWSFKKICLKQHVCLVCVRSKLNLKTELFLEKWKTFYIIDPAKAYEKQKQHANKSLHRHIYAKKHTLSYTLGAMKWVGWLVGWLGKLENKEKQTLKQIANSWQKKNV